MVAFSVGVFLRRSKLSPPTFILCTEASRRGLLFVVEPRFFLTASHGMSEPKSASFLIEDIRKSVLRVLSIIPYKIQKSKSLYFARQCTSQIAICPSRNLRFFVDICCFNRMTMKISIMYSTRMLTGKTIW